MRFWRPLHGQQVGPLFPQTRILSSNMWPHKGTETKALSQALWAMPRTRNLNQGIRVLKKGPSDRQEDRKTSAMQPPGTENTESYQKHISEWPQCTYAGEGYPGQ